MKLSRKQKLILVASTAVAVLAPELSFAAIPAAADTAITGLVTDATAMTARAWDIVVPVTSAFVMLKMFKRAANKA